MSNKIKIGDKFGKWKVVAYSHKSKQYHNYWLCECECGTQRPVNEYDLVNNKSTSCFCTTSKKTTKRNKANILTQGLQAMRHILQRYIYQANKRGYAWELTEDQFKDLTQQECFYCGQKPISIGKSKNDNGNFIYNGIDRKDNNKGYTLDNSVACCKHCNRAKSDYSLEEFYDLCKRVVNRLEQKSSELTQ